MTMALLGVGSSEDFLNRICEHIQPTEQQYELVKRRYRRVGEHLLMKDTPHESLAPDVRPQGSQLTRTATRPMRIDREVVPFDMDVLCICDIDAHTTTSERLYEVLGSRLSEDSDYRGRLSREPRCLRLDYERDDFYLDIVPACVDPCDPNSTRLLIPDRRLWQENAAPIATWRSTDPIRYAEWFDSCCRKSQWAANAECRNKVHPMPRREQVDQKAPLRCIVQLLKWKRNLDFLGQESQPSSIFLATLAARFYEGQTGLADALYAVLENVTAEIERSPARIVVPSPVEPCEDLATPMSDSAYARFCKMLSEMQESLCELRKSGEPGGYGRALTRLAGSRLARRISADVQDDVCDASRCCQLIVPSETSHLTILTRPTRPAKTQAVPRHNFHLDV